MIVWALFDSGNGCYSQAAEVFNREENGEVEIYAIGVDRENKSSRFIKLDLADYSRIQGDKTLFDTLDRLPAPDLIIASPPCESWSVASAMWGGNASWKQESDKLSRFTIRGKSDYDLPQVQFKYDRSFLNRVNGELCIYNTVEIIKRYKPSVFIIENPASSRIWHYLKDILSFDPPFENLTHYNCYGYPIKKPTRFKSNLNLNLKTSNTPASKSWDEFSKSYNERSNIPISLIVDIYKSVLSHLGNPKREQFLNYELFS